MTKYKIKFISTLDVAIVLLLLFFTTFAYANNNLSDTTITQKIRLTKEVKLNAIIAAGVINPGVEFRIANNFSFQLDAMAAFYEKNFFWTGKPFTLVSVFFEGRYYVRPHFKGFFVGVNLGSGVFKMSKGIIPGMGYDSSDNYQVGYNIMAGATLGYKLALTHRWAIEFHWSGGYQRARYEGYIRESDDQPYNQYIGLNTSAEWMIAYKGGISVSYRW